MATFKSFEEIEAWRKARVLTRDVYAATKVVPFSRDFGLRDQIQRASVSIMSNIAEGFDRGGNREFLQFLGHAKGRRGKCDRNSMLPWTKHTSAKLRLNKLTALDLETGRLIGGLMTYLRQSDMKGSKFH